MTIEIKDIKKGDVFYEAGYGMEYGFRALDDAHRIDDDGANPPNSVRTHGWAVRAKMCEGADGKPLPDEKPLRGAEPLLFFVSDDAGAYGPKLSLTRQYNMGAHA